MGSTVCKREAMQAKQLTTLFVYTNTLSETYTHTHTERRCDNHKQLNPSQTSAQVAAN